MILLKVNSQMSKVNGQMLEFVLNKSEARTILIFGIKLSPCKFTAQNSLASKLLRTF